MTELTIDIPDYRAKSRNRTATKHWRSYQMQRNETTEFVKTYAKKVVFEEPVIICITAFFKNRPIDVSNIDDKIFVDALMSIGIIKDDDPKHNPVVTKIVISEAPTNHVTITVKPWEFS